MLYPRLILEVDVDSKNEIPLIPSLRLKDAISQETSCWHINVCQINSNNNEHSPRDAISNWAWK